MEAETRPCCLHDSPRFLHYTFSRHNVNYFLLNAPMKTDTRCFDVSDVMIFFPMSGLLLKFDFILQNFSTVEQMYGVAMYAQYQDTNSLKITESYFRHGCEKVISVIRRYANHVFLSPFLLHCSLIKMTSGIRTYIFDCESRRERNQQASNSNPNLKPVFCPGSTSFIGTTVLQAKPCCFSLFTEE